ncbi:pyridoxamine 5'-phosphate oxidase family protein [Clostridium boliviensis]|uniref:Pyridoxamine 5'-phosphate oxidase family protein n=1 Tax=Clostridium boliviensis TaxID=318465 RepID=A0ABU4GLY7_9CLOT|nr:pyridoxamine 5'-phosphate oxidase family protein [Clostridium boliviensis]MDW2798631.1 pyridoxamine 5'-phosphate oxidase family protein [Clostridium boliviensis]
MFREMRRKNQALSSEECMQVLNRATTGVLAVSGDDDYPYAVPLSYVYRNNRIYFHGAKTGHKLDAIVRNEKVSFCVIDQDQIVQEEYTTYFRSVIAFGRARILGEEDKRRALEILTARYSPDIEETERSQAIDKGLKDVCMIELEIEYMSGKESIKLVKQKNNS